jgi:hypothetical protein
VGKDTDLCIVNKVTFFLLSMKRAREESSSFTITPLTEKDGVTPTAAGVMLECVRASGLWNMFTDWKRACQSAVALGVYLGQPLDPTCVTLDFFVFKTCYENAEYRRRAAAAVSALPGSPDYVAALRRWNKDQAMHGFKELIQEAEEECKKWARYARDVEGASTPEPILYGAWRLLEEGDRCDYTPTTRVWNNK